MRFNLRMGRRGLPFALSTVPEQGGAGNGLFELRVDRGDRSASDCGASDDGGVDVALGCVVPDSISLRCK
jgi:hypothetical protein